MRFGLVGTGPWAASVHGPGIQAAEDVELAGVWGRSDAKADALADRFGVPSFPTFDDLLADVDAVAFAVPPDVQAELATRAAAAGRHLLLDKPVATSVVAARRLRDAAAEQGVASVVFFTDRFSVQGGEWFDTLAGHEWHGGSVRWLASLEGPGSRFGALPWRHEKGALWDIGPHALSTLTAALGPVVEISAVAGRRDLIHLVLRHDTGATSTATLSLFAPTAAAHHEVIVWGEQGTSRMPDHAPGGAVHALGTPREPWHRRLGPVGLTRRTSGSASASWSCSTRPSVSCPAARWRRPSTGSGRRRE